MSHLQTLEQLLQHTEALNGLTALHGFFCCVYSQPKLTKRQRFAQLQKLSKRISTKEQQALEYFTNSIATDLSSDELNLRLPEALSNSDNLQQGIEQLQQWIDGFTLALGIYHAKNSYPLHADVQEWLSDLNRVYRHCQWWQDTQQQKQKPITIEEDLLDLMHIQEFIRTGLLLYQTTLQQHNITH